MKKANLFLFILSFVLTECLFLSCCDKDEDFVPSLSTEFAVSTNSMTFAKGGGSVFLSVRTTATPVLSCSESWVTISNNVSTSNITKKYSVEVAANSDLSDRSATISVSAGTQMETVTISQTAADGLLISSSTAVSLAAEGGDFVVTLNSNGDYKVTIDESAYWLTQTNTKANMAESKCSFVASANMGEARSATISFSLGNLVEVVTVSQDAGENNMNSDAMTLAAKMYAGWNIGNTLEAIGGETAWNNPEVTNELIQYVKSLGFNAIRIPCSWNQYITDEVNYTISEAWLNRVNEVVGYCVANDVYAIVNIHWDGGWLEENCTSDKQDANKAKQKALWTQIANKLNGYDEHLLFAGCNEPNVENAEQMAVLLSYEQTFVDAVRATGGNNATRCLIVQGPSTDVDKTHTLMTTLPTDIVKNRMMVEVHYYSPWNFCGLEADADWGKMSYFWGAANHVSGSDRNCASGYEEDYVVSQFQKMQTKFVSQGIPVILGEYGAIYRTLKDNQEEHDKSRGYFNEVVTREAKNHGLVPFFWDGGNFAMIKRNCTIYDQYSYDGIMKGASEGTYPY